LAEVCKPNGADTVAFSSVVNTVNGDAIVAAAATGGSAPQPFIEC
jgi:hypothetical protein